MPTSITMLCGAGGALWLFNVRVCVLQMASLFNSLRKAVSVFWIATTINTCNGEPEQLLCAAVVHNDYEFMGCGSQHWRATINLHHPSDHQPHCWCFPCSVGASWRSLYIKSVLGIEARESSNGKETASGFPFLPPCPHSCVVQGKLPRV